MPTDLPSAQQEERQSPSYARRLALREADSAAAAATTIRVLDAFPLSKYLALAERLRHAFEAAVDERNLDAAYLYGLRFATFSLESLPRHREWKQRNNNNRYSSQKRRNAQQVDRVLSVLEIVKQRMDAEELVKQKQRQQQEEEQLRQEKIREAADEELKRKEEDEIQQQQQRQQRSEEEEAQRKRLQVEQEATLRRQEAERRQQGKAQQNKEKIEQSAMAKLQALGSSMMTVPSSAAAKREEQQPIQQSTQVVVAQEQDDNHKSSNDSSRTERSKRTSSLASFPDNDNGATASFTDMMAPRTAQEQQTIDRLNRTIRINVERIENIENREIPQLLQAAKAHLRQQGKISGRKPALQCLARKKRLARQANVLKAANFNMETQAFVLENSFEQRQVDQMLREAAEAMKSLNDGSGSAVVDDLSDDVAAANLAIQEFAEDGIEEENEDELLEELHRWISLSSANNAETDGAIPDDAEDVSSILSLPSIPSSTAPTALPSKKEESSTSVGKQLLKAVLS